MINYYTLLSVVTVILAITHESLEYKEFLLEDPMLCSPITKRKIKLGTGSNSGLLVKQSRLNIHSIPWNVDSYCKFEVQSKGGVAAVIQKLKMRRSPSTGQCIDYVQFRTKDHTLSPKYCGEIDAFDPVAGSFRYDNNFISSFNSFIDKEGEMNVEVFVAKTPLLGGSQRMELVLAFTSYRDCSVQHQYYYKEVDDDELQSCSDISEEICINKVFFNDKIVNCPYIGCADENSCIEQVDVEVPEQNMSVGHKVLLGSLSSLCIVFAIFVVCLWAFKHHKLLCWTPQYARGTSVAERRQQSDRTNVGQTEPLSTTDITLTTAPTAPPLVENRDMPPAYDSLFPTHK